MTFKVGDIVTLKSDGPEMTVRQIYKNDTLECVWFARDLEGAPLTATFPTETLKLYQKVDLSDY
ncbi:MAG: DUF2158 domain-containing protein [Moritella sp.]|uniref:YodC family protein n=1 Tax=Moritella sp. TaxID=78556 RepID=UPI000C0EA842|nr:DUF2158 domain-containing protein [Moritella sp.]MBL1417195.1 DUF2158 domain-containing protein [Moritella sp.]